MSSNTINIFLKFRFLYISSLLLIIYATIQIEKTEVSVKTKEVEISTEKNENTIPSLNLYLSIKKWSDYYGVPEHIAFNVAYKETGYRGPLHFRYNPNLTSSAGAKGAMQIMPTTANWVEKRKISKNKLSRDIDLNVQISMKYLNQLHREYHSWPVALGFYNTGYPLVNEYANYCYNNKNYKNKWFKSI